jgi:HEAT repeat protein
MGMSEMRSLEDLAKGLRHEDAEVRWVTVLLLEEMRTPEAVDLLIAALGDPFLSVRWRATIALGNIGDRSAVEPLIRALEDPSQHVRKEAAASLGGVGDPRAIEPLVGRLTDPDAGVRIAAARALVSIGEPARPALLKASDAADPRLREEAREAVRDLDFRLHRLAE